IISCPSCGGKNRVAPERVADRPVCGRCGESLPPVDVPVDLDDTTFDAVVTRARVPVVVDFWAPWCGPCLAFSPIVADLARTASARMIVAKVNVDAAPRTAARFRVMSIP